MFELLARKRISYKIYGNPVWAQGSVTQTVQMMSYEERFTEVVYPEETVLQVISKKRFMVSVLVRLNRVVIDNDSWSKRYKSERSSLLIIGESLEDALLRADIELSKRLATTAYRNQTDAEKAASYLNLRYK